MYFGSFYDPTLLLLIPAFIFAIVAQAKVKSTYNRYSKVPIKKGLTGEQVAKKILAANGVFDVTIEVSGGTLSDHYDPRKKVVRLSPDVYGQATISAVGIAAHETGHALQHEKGYKPLILRDVICVPVNVMSMLSWPLMIIGIIVMQLDYTLVGTGNLLFDIGVIGFVAVVLFHTITLPVEINASRRAIKELNVTNTIYPEEAAGAKKVLFAAAMTYVAALAVAVAQLIRILLIRGRD